jgi:hypothetical protein
MDLIALYQQRLNLQNANFSQIEHDDAMVAVVYRVTQPSGTEFILKICPRDEDYRREVYFLKYFADKLPVPRIMQVVKPETGISGAVLMECLPGAPLKITDMTDALAFEIGALLAKIHLNPAAGYGDLTQPDDLTLDPRVYFTLKFEEGIDECINHLPEALIEECHRYYDTHIHLLASVDGPCMRVNFKELSIGPEDAAALPKKIFALWNTGNGLCSLLARSPFYQDMPVFVRFRITAPSCRFCV